MLVEFISKMFDHSFEKEWYETYWAFDLHGTIIRPTYNSNGDMEYYPYALDVLRLLTKRPDIKLILWTCSYPEEIKDFLKEFELDKIHFDAVNKNPGISSKNGNFGYYEDKFYFNVLFDDKAGFDPEKEWKLIYDFLISCEIANCLPNPAWTTKY
jgi:hydroxymethylpyrimidine pyrophosphatase-like HAD family hydrolase